MTTAQELVKQFQVTPGRIGTISKELFEEEKAEFTSEEVLQVAGVVKIMKDGKERSVRAAVKSYRAGGIKEVASNPREYAPQPANLTATGKLGNKAIAEDDHALAQLRALQRLFGIRETENKLLAFYLNAGPGELPAELEELLEVSNAEVHDAALGNFERVAGYLPAMVGSGAMLLSAAVEENQAA